MLLIYLIIIHLSRYSVDTGDIFDVEADELMDSILKNVYSGRFQQSNLIYKSTTPMSKPTTKSKLRYSTDVILGATVHPALQKYPENMTIDEFNLRKRKMDLKILLESDVKHIPNFNVNDDEIEVQARRFDKVLERQKVDDTRRENYFDFENTNLIYAQKNRTISLMAQFVYETRYKLPHAQLLRKKYLNNIRYRIGYCFALLRTLKQQQMVIYSTMKNYHTRFLSLYIHVKLYEKVVKLNVDIKDLISYIKHLDKIRPKSEVTKKNTIRP